MSLRSLGTAAGGGDPSPSASTVGIFYVDPASGNDSNDGRRWATAKATIAAALTAASSTGEIRLARGVHNVTSTLVVPQGVALVGFDAKASTQGSEIVWTGADDGSYVIRTAGDTSGSDWTQGRLSNLRLRPNATKPGGGAYTSLNGLYARNIQNNSRIDNLQIRNFPGRGIRADWANAGVPSSGFPGYVTFDRVWSTGNTVNWDVHGGYTSVLYLMCAGDVSSNTTDVFILDTPTGGSANGRFGNHIFIGFKSEDNGTPTGAGADPNYFTVNCEAAIHFDGCAGFRGAPGTKPWLNYTAAPASANALSGGIPVKITATTVSNFPVMVKGPDGTSWLAPLVGSAGEAFQVGEWSGQSEAPKKWRGTHSGLVADALALAGSAPGSPVLDVVPAAGQTAAVQRISGAVLTDTAANASTTDTGQTITFATGTWQRTGTTRYTTSATTDGRAYIPVGVADYTLQGTVHLSGGVGRAGFMFRHTDGNNHLRVMLLTTGSLEVQAMTAGVQTTLASKTDTTIVAGGTYVVTVKTSGTSITVSVNGLVKATITLTGADATNFTSPTNVGYRQDNSTGGDDGGSRLGPLYVFAPTVQVTPAGAFQVWNGTSWATVSGASIAHATTHQRAGADQVTPQMIGAAPGRLSSTALLQSETFPRWGINLGSAVVAGTVHLTRITLVAGTYSTLTFSLGTAGLTPANWYFGLYDASNARVAVSAEQSATLVGLSGLRTATLSATVTAGDYYIAVLVGSAGTLPQFAAAAGGPASAVLALDPATATSHLTGSQTTLPATATPMTTANASGVKGFWFRYE